MTRLLLLFAIAVAFPLAGCGQKGPLYLPGDPSEIQVGPGQLPPEDSEDDEDAEDDESGD